MSDNVLDSKIPAGAIADKWDNYKADMKLVNPNNKRKFKVIVVGSGLAGASAAATMAELGYDVEVFTFHDSPRRAHSIAAQGGINAAKNYRGDGDSVHRLFYDTIKGGDFRAREGNVHRLAQVSLNIIDQMVAQGVPFAREYGGLLDTRSFGGSQLQRTFYARGQTGQQLLLGAYQQLARQIGLGTVKLWNRVELVDTVIVDGRCAGIVTRDLVTGEVRSHAAHATVMCTGGYGNAFFLSTNAMNCNVTAAWRAHRKGAYFANPCYTQIHPTCIPQADDTQSKLTLMSESLRNDGRVWVPVNAGDERPAAQIPEAERDYYLERLYPSFGNLAPRDISSRAAKRAVDSGRGVGPLKNGVNLDFADAIGRLGQDVVKERYGNLFEMYERITGENPYAEPMRIYPASHYTMGGLWVDYELMTTVPGLYAAGEANFSDHGANRLGASALMQGLADGYFVLPYTIGNYLAPMLNKPIPGTDHPEFQAAEQAARQRFQGFLDIRGTRSPDYFHRELGKIIWDYCGMERTEQGLQKALSELPALYDEFKKDLRVTGDGAGVNQTLEKAGRVEDFFELGMLMCRDALERNESCGGHFRAEYQDEEGEAQRDDEHFAHVAAWEFTGDPMHAVRHKEELEFETIHLAKRSYK
ncbi:MAG: fumarate reductase/succinate dehydrogenase flavoprotein subunit [Ilumatobacteraceae bacterium]|jgi:succinate dehydrogenase / fumarate reductase flavoprotein subunit|nr:fumarate reductase/succinate dehydrogenase flavoprotein subunit [Acidimicrobiaceae bacterium]MBP6488411.1 fumarate reductase/succinate dehydrogenase flavoprotein subunit [Ilumatobacteraceae bacterium]MBP7889468.1 fumarate reductase/succinate dehydrogenase flavoprotein subunit [Ilumatobacteraceae bacterium]MBP8210814.1 fumarate reductase/succinate dehydrogenase flavoprotein subunit [Ilumatobacteraceae bacterium]MBP9051988.1 fumarate reductase/succinate dehydrogenase flavoprotein subunit [Ilum